MVLDSAEDTVVAEHGETVAGAEEQRDDVIAEADVYLAYGIYQQAEELLSQAINDNPDRDNYRVKLAETQYAAKNKDGFLAVATELKSRLDDDSPLWKKVVGMGQDLCADDPLFQGSMVGVPVEALAPDEPSMDFDLGVDEPSAEEPAPDLDLSLDEPLDMPEGDSSSAEEEAAELEFDLSDTGAVDEGEAADDGFSLDIDASELDIESDESAALADAAEEEAIDIADLDLDMSDTGAVEESVSDEVESLDAGLDFSLDDSESPAVEEPEETMEAADDLALDLTEEAAELDMNLDEPAEAPAAEVVSEEEADIDLSEDAADDFDLSNLDDVDEVSTKLDLARAYLDMGDHEGTRGILDEVLAEGNEAQKQEANELLAQLE
jgi:pilus assembly protein FimV